MDPINPDYYTINGADTLPVARELTFCAGSALKYIIRSSRLDGVYKGDRVQDLKKAVRFLREEIDRISTHDPA